MIFALYEIDVPIRIETISIRIWEDDIDFECWPTIETGERNYDSTDLGLRRVTQLGRDEALFFSFELVEAHLCRLNLSQPQKKAVLKVAASRIARVLSELNEELAMLLLSKVNEGGTNVRSAGLEPTQDNIIRWGAFASEDILEAIDRGFPSAEEFLRYGDYFKDYDEVLEASDSEVKLRVEGFTAKEIDQLKTNQVKLETAIEWRRTGIQIALIQDWAQANSPKFGSQLEDPGALRWAQLGFNPSQLQSWRDAGLTIKDARQFLTIEFDIEIALEWVTKRFSLRTATEWFQAGVVTPSKAKTWEDANILPSEVEQWVELGLNSPNKVKKWVELGLNTPILVKKWRRVGLTKLTDVAEWSKFFTPDEAAAWVEAGVEPKVAARRAAAGVRPWLDHD